MFTVDYAVEQGVKNAKTVSALITNKELRTEVDRFIDAQAEYTKTLVESVTKIGKAFYGSVATK